MKWYRRIRQLDKELDKSNYSKTHITTKTFIATEFVPIKSEQQLKELRNERIVAVQEYEKAYTLQFPWDTRYI